MKLDDNSKTLEAYGLTDKSAIIYKDLGPQIDYRTVFVLEYAGPLVFVLAYAAIRVYNPSLIWSGGNVTKEFNQTALWGVIAWCFHFLKREYETFFIHKFSNPTMPLSNLYKNCMYYWTFGLVIGYPLCSPMFKSPDDLQVLIGLGIFILSELGNLICHVMLSKLRKAEGAKNRPIPSGFLFDFVACPNYTFEVLSWVGFSIMTSLPLSYLFTFVGFAQMTQWALKKHKEYKKTYDKEYKKKYAIIPFII